jgi:hypothetical protein
VLVLIAGAGDAEALQPALRTLADRGHEVRVFADPVMRAAAGTVDGAADALAPMPVFPFSSWSVLDQEVRRARAYVRSAAASTRDAPALLAEAPWRYMAAWPAHRSLLTHGLEWSERAIPPEPEADAFVKAQAPDLVLTADGVSGDAATAVRSARALGISVVTWPVRDGMASEAALDRIEALGRVRGAPGQAWYASALRVPLARAAQRLARTDGARAEKVARQQQVKEQREAALVARRADVAAGKRQAAEEQALRRQQEKARVQAERQAVAQVAEKAFADYEAVRAWAAARRDGFERAVTLGDAERQQAAALAHLWQATPDTIARLRRACAPVSGVRAEDYEPGSPEAALEIRSALGVLWRQVGRDLYVPEAPTLGGFGYPKNDELYNEETVRFFTAAVALQDGGILGGFRPPAPRRLVWEIGGGWGGFAYQFKRLCPNVTYLITGRPDTFLLSAVYLQAVFPGARCRFVDPATADAVWREWHDVDFVFATEDALPVLQPPQLDLTIDLTALRGMTAGRVDAHVRRAFDLGSRFFYSLLPGVPSADDVACTWARIERLFWPHPVPARRDQVRDDAPPAPDLFSHLVGWRRLRV